MRRSLIIIPAMILVVLRAHCQALVPQGEITNLVEAERAFAKDCLDEGIRDSFLKFFADSSVIFVPEPVAARPRYLARPKSAAVLTWRPAFAEVSAAGDMGYTTGPWEYRKSSPADPPAGYGEFFTVWKKQKDGTWKVMLDVGIEHGKPSVADSSLNWHSPEMMNVPEDGSGSPENAIREKERSLSKRSGEAGFREALLSSADEGCRVFREERFPAVGTDAARKALEGEEGRLVWKPTLTGIARSGDLGYSYGIASKSVGPGGREERTSYVRIWRRDRAGVWKVVVDIAKQIPEKKVGAAN